MVASVDHVTAVLCVYYGATAFWSTFKGSPMNSMLQLYNWEVT